MNGALNYRSFDHCNSSGSHASLCVFPHQLMIALDRADKEFCTSRYKALHARFHRATAIMCCRTPGQISSHSALESLLLIESDARSPFSGTPQWAVVNDDFQIIEWSNELSRFLKVSAGRFQNRIVCLARDSLQAGFRSALQDARRHRHQVIYDRQLVYRKNGIRRVSITHVDSANSETLVDCALMHPLKQKLLTPQNDLENTVQALQASNAELKASNEKLLSIIKKLQAPEKAFDTGKVKVAKHFSPRARDDLEHRSQNKQIVTQFLNWVHRIKRFTPAMPCLDIGRASEAQVLTFPDITHATSAEKFTRSVIDSLYCFVSVCDTQGNMLEANCAILEANGMTPGEAIGKPLCELHWWSHSYETKAQLDEATTQAVAGRISRFDMTVRMVDERLVVIDFQMVPMRNSVGTITHLIASAIDVTNRRHTESALAHSEEKMRGLLSEIEEIYTSLPVGLCVLDSELRYVRINKQLADMNGLPVEAHLGKTVAELLPDLATTMIPALQKVLDSGEAITNISISGETPREPGVLRHWLESWLPMRNSQGEIFGVNIVAEEITERKRHEAQLLAMQAQADAARCAAEKASRLKSEFLANMSHEIRTPMTAILGYADLLALKIKQPDNLQSVQTIKRNGQFLVELLDDILDLSRIEAGKMTLETRVFDPANVVEQICELMQVRAEQQRLTLCVNYVSKLPSVIHSDPKRVRQILVNLISNAIKFTEQGSVTLQVDYVIEPEPSLRFSVIDTGIGMDDRQCTEVLEAFTQADSSICRRFGGSGLGLAISKRLIDMLGGHLSIDSRLGAGTAVTVLVPVGPVETLVLKTPARPTLTIPAEASASIRLPYRILILDDQRDVRQVVQSVLEQAGAEVISADNGDAALRYFSVFAEMPIDAMVLDMHMPGVNGFEVTRQLRAYGAKLPIIALTADAMLGTREKCLAAGCTDYFTKPIDHAAFLTCLHRHLQKFSASNGSSHGDFEHTESSAQPTEKLSVESGQTIDSGCESILVIDDHHDSAYILASLLKEYGHTVCCAGSAKEAREQLELITPSLVLSDISLPDEDGYSLVASLRERPELTHCRFIALTGCDTLDSVRGKVFEAHVIKPFDIEALLMLIDETGVLTVSGADSRTGRDHSSVGVHAG